jgi:putative oxidoreductase
MKKLLSTKYSAGAFNTAIFLLRIAVALLMMNHGYDKLVHFASKQNTFMNLMGMGSTVSLLLVIFAEFFCSLFLLLGLFTRLSCIPLIITMCFAIFKIHKGEVFGDGETDTLYLATYIVILLLGPGKISVDGISGK